MSVFVGLSENLNFKYSIFELQYTSEVCVCQKSDFYKDSNYYLRTLIYYHVVASV